MKPTRVPFQSASARTISSSNSEFGLIRVTTAHQSYFGPNQSSNSAALLGHSRGTLRPPSVDAFRCAHTAKHTINRCLDRKVMEDVSHRSASISRKAPIVPNRRVHSTWPLGAQPRRARDDSTRSICEPWLEFRSYPPAPLSARVRLRRSEENRSGKRSRTPFSSRALAGVVV